MGPLATDFPRHLTLSVSFPAWPLLGPMGPTENLENFRAQTYCLTDARLLASKKISDTNQAAVARHPCTPESLKAHKHPKAVPAIREKACNAASLTGCA